MERSAPHVLIRTEGGRQIGFGHVRRCLTLARALQDLGATTTFLLAGDADVCQVVAGEGYAAHPAGEHASDPSRASALARQVGAQAVVVDSYTVGTPYFAGLLQAGTVVVAIDDLADRALPIHLVVNGSAGASREQYAAGGPATQLLTGPAYMLLRPEFAGLPPREVRAATERVLITLGGTNPHGLAARLLAWAGVALPRCTIDMVIGPLFSDQPAIAAAAAALEGRARLLVTPPDMRALMLAADVALSGGGQTSYELAATGTPAVAIQLAGNQRDNLNGLSLAGALTVAGDALDGDLGCRVERALRRLADDYDARTAMSRAGQALVDGKGAARVARAIMAQIGKSRS